MKELKGNSLHPKLKEIIKLLGELNMKVILAYDEQDESIITGLVAGSEDYITFAVTSMQGLTDTLEAMQILDEEGNVIDQEAEALLQEEEDESLSSTLVSTRNTKKKTYLN